MEAFVVSTGLVAVAEIGDKTQLLAFMLAARFRRPLPVVLGILVATVANHLLAASLGALAADWLGPDALRWILGLSFLAMGAWTLVPDRLEGDGAVRPQARYGPFLTTLFCFFLLEMGDKTQIATIALAARFDSLLWVTAGSTFGMMLTNVPAVLLGERAVKVVPAHWVHRIAAAVFALLGVAVLAGLGH